MDEKRAVVIGVTVVIAVATITILAVTLSSTEEKDVPGTDGNDTQPFNTLLLISLDGFRADYLARGKTPTLLGLIKDGVYAPYMKPSYPTITFPNHYTIVTGLYPENHGIIANHFKDPDIEGQFDVGGEGSCDSVWWEAGEPMWITLNKQGKRSATYFWPGSDCNITGITPDEYYPYDAEVPFQDRVDQVLEWLSRPDETRPHWVTLYFREPDHTGHQFGPDTDAVDNQLIIMDGLIDNLMTGLRERGLRDSVNIIIVSDHGMANSPLNKALMLNEFVSDIETTTDVVYTGSFSRIQLKESNDDSVKSMLEQLSCQNNSMRAYAKKDLPRRFHFRNNDRIEDIVLDLNEGYYTKTKSQNWTDALGQHGYDNYFSTMNALFIATGPDFRAKVVLDSFPNTELYHLMCYLTQVHPASHDGTIGSLNAALVDPVPIPELPEGDDIQDSEVPDDLTDAQYNMSKCTNKVNVTWDWVDELKFNDAEMKELDSLHLPWGIPLADTRNNSMLRKNGTVTELGLTLLYHHDHVTIYSNVLKTPLLTSVTLETRPIGSVEDKWWYSDVRLTEDTTATCESYDAIDPNPHNYTMMPLFPPMFSGLTKDNGIIPEIPYLISNAVPATTEIGFRWKTLMKALKSLAGPSRNVNIIMGPVFSKDVFNITKPPESFPILPSDLYAVVTWCRVKHTKLPDCDPSDLRAVGFIYPETQLVWNCLGRDEGLVFAMENSCTVRDIEGMTGLILYPNLSPSNRTRVLLQSSTPPSWPMDESLL